MSWILGIQDGDILHGHGDIIHIGMGIMAGTRGIHHIIALIIADGMILSGVLDIGIIRIITRIATTLGVAADRQLVIQVRAEGRLGAIQVRLWQPTMEVGYLMA